MNIKDEQFVVYLFSLFHRELDFEHVIQMQLGFPDCTAVKEGKQVTIEFEKGSDTLREHIGEPIVYRNLPGNEVSETSDEILAKEGSETRTYPKSEYHMYTSPYQYDIRKKVLKLDYCVCWEINHNPSDFIEEYSLIKGFIELRKNPIIIDFMEKRKRSLELLQIKDLTTAEN
jgi:hypothetical protein